MGVFEKTVSVCESVLHEKLNWRPWTHCSSKWERVLFLAWPCSTWEKPPPSCQVLPGGFSYCDVETTLHAAANGGESHLNMHKDDKAFLRKQVSSAYIHIKAITFFIFISQKHSAWLSQQNADSALPQTVPLQITSPNCHHCFTSF